MSKVKKNLVHYQDLIIKIREFFYSRKVTEVKTPSLLFSPSTDVYIDSIEVKVNRDISRPTDLYLHTSPELEMKRLLSKGSGDIFQICQVYRDNAAPYTHLRANDIPVHRVCRLLFEKKNFISYTPLLISSRNFFYLTLYLVNFC